ncbi:MAG: hypothetical protein HYT27_00935 [Parcubacteria group bacterium]|nr:hypothetical protein [Parcubacteria group bacterium]
MTITTTAIAFTLSSLGLMFCGSRFFKAFQKIGGSRAGKKIGILLSILHLGFALVNGTLGIGTLFFAGNSEILYRFVLVAHFFLAITAVVGIYLVFYILFPLTSPWPGVTLAFILGIGVIILTVITHPLPFVDTGGGVDLNFSRLLSVPLA